tara:strand:- start:420 stop:785 length:366 start_codon:yes stop_codon:yes gene_type:complete
MSIHSNITITIDVNGLVWDRGEFLKQEMSVTQNDFIAEKLRKTLTFDTIYHMVDTSILEFFDNHEHPEIWDTHYGETAGNEPAASFEKAAKAREKAKKEFKIVKLSSPSWTIDVPVRINKE